MKTQHQISLIMCIIFAWIPNFSIAKDSNKSKEKEHLTGLYGSEMNDRFHFEDNKSLSAETPDLQIGSNWDTNDEGETDAPANPDDPDAPIDQTIGFLLMAGVILGYTLKTNTLQTNKRNS